MIHQYEQIAPLPWKIDQQRQCGSRYCWMVVIGLTSVVCMRTQWRKGNFWYDKYGERREEECTVYAILYIYMCATRTQRINTEYHLFNTYVRSHAHVHSHMDGAQWRPNCFRQIYETICHASIVFCVCRVMYYPCDERSLVCLVAFYPCTSTRSPVRRSVSYLIINIGIPSTSILACAFFSLPMFSSVHIGCCFSSSIDTSAEYAGRFTTWRWHNACVQRGSFTKSN